MAEEDPVSKPEEFNNQPKRRKLLPWWVKVFIWVFTGLGVFPPLSLRFNNPSKIRRRKLLPWWIKVFIWIFIGFGVIAPLGFIYGIIGNSFELSLYGFETYEPISLMGLSILALFLLKGTVGFGLWLEQDWAVLLAKIDAVIGILICIYSLFILPFININSDFINLRLGLIILIPYLTRLFEIEKRWKENRYR